MSIEGLNQIINSFVDNEIKCIESYINNLKNVKSEMFFSGYTFYGKVILIVKSIKP